MFKKSKLLFMFAALVATMPAMAQQVNYSVDGTYAQDGEKIYLIDKLTDNAIDSMVVAGGKFAFKGAAEKDAFLAVSTEDQKWPIVFFNDGTPVTVNVNDSTLKGSPLNERLVKYDLEQDALMKNMRAKISKLSREEIEAQAEEIMAEMNKVIDEQVAFACKVFQEERNSLIPLLFAQFYFYDNGVEEYEKLVNENLPFSKHPYLKKARDEVAEVLQPESGPKAAFIGQKFTDLEMADPDGKMHKISELVGEGKWVLVDFWASWCGPCRAEMPNVLEAYNKFHDKGFEVVGVSFDEKKDAWVRAIGQLKMPWLQISDLKGWECAAAPIYKIDGIPDNILIDPQGTIIERGLRGKMLQTRLKKIFGE